MTPDGLEEEFQEPSVLLFAGMFAERFAEMPIGGVQETKAARPLGGHRRRRGTGRPRIHTVALNSRGIEMATQLVVRRRKAGIQWVRGTGRLEDAWKAGVTAEGRAPGRAPAL